MLTFGAGDGKVNIDSAIKRIHIPSLAERAHENSNRMLSVEFEASALHRALRFAAAVGSRRYLSLVCSRNALLCASLFAHRVETTRLMAFRSSNAFKTLRNGQIQHTSSGISRRIDASVLKSIANC